jgi:general stress protein 26
MTTRKEHVQKINNLIGKVQVAMMVTQDSDGSLRSRPMTTQEREFDGDVWFFASSDSDVVKEVKAHPQVNIAYSDRGNYVSLSGKGSIVMDVAKKKELWNAELKVWFEGAEPESPTVALIKVDASHAEYWDAPNGIVGNAVTAIRAALSRDEESPIDSGTATFK